MKQKGLGRGLDAIFGGNIEAKVKPMSEMVEVSLSDIVPNPTQPRTEFDEEALEELADSIKQLGLIQPITVKRDGDKYIIISGERRWRAAERAGLKVLPAYIREVDDTTLHAMALVENIQREDLNAIEISLGMQRLVEECGLTQEALAERLGKKRSTVANYLRLLNLPEEIQFAIKSGVISMGHAKSLVAVESRAKQLSLLKRCVKNNLSVRQLEELVRLASEKRAKVTAAGGDEEYPLSYSLLVEHLEKLFSQDISIKRGKNGGGKIIIDFASDKDIDKFIKRLSNR
ncbi:MAG: ParB/RepB/Spo0J family partition protein [Rikenellaceae bacterium]|nr:ParB/RepB/Spo0J family partition protein [Rikenellaceae bacterium]